MTELAIVLVPILLFVARLLARSESVTLWPVLPTWADVTTWPWWAQVLGEQFQAGVVLWPDALQAAAVAGLSAIGLYHAAKRVTQ